VGISGNTIPRILAVLRTAIAERPIDSAALLAVIRWETGNALRSETSVDKVET